MATTLPLILTAVASAATQEVMSRRTEKAKKREGLIQQEKLDKKQKINDRIRKQRNISLLASERARLGAAGVGVKSDLARSIINGLTERQEAEQGEAAELYSLDSETLLQKRRRTRGPNLLEQTIKNL